MLGSTRRVAGPLQGHGGIEMAKAEKHKWTFRARFRRQAFGWKSQPAIKRVKEAVSEIRKAARKDPLLGAEGAVLFLEKVSPAIEQVDGSSGAIGRAVNNAIEALVPLIARAPADAGTRGAWLERLWEAHQDDEIPYIESLGDHWGTLCASKETASQWADQLVDVVRQSWSPDPSLQGFFHGISACFSALFAAGRQDEILELLELAPYRMWHDRQWGVRALAALGRPDEALRYAQASQGLNDSPLSIARACEEVLLACGRDDEAFEGCAIQANQGTTYLATYRAIAKKYPHKQPAEILSHLVASTPCEEGKWFATAKQAGLYSQAIQLAKLGPCDPLTLIRAARDFEDKNPSFAVEAGVAAFRWLALGYGYELTGFDVRSAYMHTMKAAENAGCADQARERIRKLASKDSSGARFVADILRLELELQPTRNPGSWDVSR